MMIWMAIVGAVLGWFLADFSEFGFIGGGLVGLFAGWILRRAMRHEVRAETARLHDELEALRGDIAALYAAGSAAVRDDDAPAPARASNVPRVEVRQAARIVSPSAALQPDLDATALPEHDASPDRPAEPSRIETPAKDAVAVARDVLFGATPAYSPATSRDPADTTGRFAKPGWIESQVGDVITVARNWLFGGNTIVRLGLVILFVGLSFLASYAASAGLFPIEFRLALVGLFGIALLVIGFRTRDARRDFALALQGGGVAIIYLTLFGAARFYDLVPLGAAFVLMIAVCALGCALALLQRSQALAVTAFAGGFAVPLLVGGESGAALGLFGYGTILNLAILYIARAQSWRVLNLVGFAATFGIATLWGSSAYQPGDFMIAQIFLIVSVLIYVAMAMLYTQATPGRFGNAVDTTLLFGPALTGFGLEVALVGDRPFGSAFAALGFAALYLGLAAFSMRHRRAELRVMNDAMLAIGIGFVTMAVPLALGARWTSAAWAIEGAGAFWVGARQARWVPRLFGLLLQIVATMLFFAHLDDNIAALPLANAAFVGAILVALGWLVTAWLARTPIAPGETRLARAYGQGEALIAVPAFLIGFATWWIGWVSEATRLHMPAERAFGAGAVFSASVQILLSTLAFVASAALFQAIARRYDWSIAGWPARFGVVALWLGFLGSAGLGRYVLDTPEWLLWIAAIAIHMWMLCRGDRALETPAQEAVAAAGHVGGVWLAVAFIGNMLWMGIDRAALWSTAWSEVTLLAGAVAVLAALSLWAGPVLRDGGAATRWPLDRQAASYGWIAAVPIAIIVFAGALIVSLFSSGDAAPLPFVPLLNPVDLIVALAAGVLLLWARTVLAARPLPSGATLLDERGPWLPLAALAFAAVNGAWLRTAHHLAGIAWTGDALLGSALVQSGIAILWTLIALTLMVAAHRRAQRGVWIAGAVLLGATVVKLLLVDLNATGGGARIIAFIAVGMLMLLVGYLAPLPPREPAISDSDGPGREAISDYEVGA